MPFFDDAPMIDFQDTAETTDFFLYQPSDALADDPADGSGTWADDFTGTLQGGDGAGPSDPATFDSSDTFAFIAFGPQDGASTGDNAAPAPPEEPEVDPVQEFVDREWSLDRTRHSSTLALIQGILTGSY